MSKLIEWIKKHWDVFSYLFFGVLTTAVDFVVYLPCYNWLHLSSALSNIIAWCVAAAFAYLTNKPFVFGSHDWSPETVLPELAKFLACRVGSGLFQTAALFVTVDLLHWDGNIMKALLSVVVVILNYVGSKLLVFRNNK